MGSNLHKPVLIVIAGPNGSGKTTITSRILQHEWLEDSIYINPDNIAQNKFGDWNNQEAEIAKFTPQELREYEASMRAYNDIQNSIDTAIEKGREEGREEERAKNAKSFLAMGLSPEQVAQGTGLPLKEVLRIQKGI